MAKPENPFDKTQEEDPFAKARGRLVGASSSFEKIAIEDNLGKLLLLTPTEFHSKVQTRFTKPGEEGSDAVTVDAVVFSDNGEDPEELTGVMVFPKMLVGQLKAFVGKDQPVLGRLAKVPSQKGHPAWSLDSDLPEADIDTALAYLDEKEKAAKADARAKLGKAAKE